eukprot:COSAG02_NODE_12279_length_1569_cov_1.646939_1_plen_254_part_00
MARYRYDQTQKALAYISKGTAGGERVDGKFIQTLANCSVANGSRYLDRYLKLLRRKIGGSDDEAGQTLQVTTNSIESCSVVEEAIAKFARQLGAACTMRPSVVCVEPPHWEVHVSGHSEGCSVPKYGAAKDKVYYTLECIHKLSGGSADPASTRPKPVYRRWGSLLRLFKDLSDIERQLKRILSKNGAAGDDMLEFPKQPAGLQGTAADRLRQLQKYFVDWNRWHAALRERHGFAVTELRDVWDFLTLDVILA